MFEFVLDLASPKRRVHVYGDGSCGNDTEETGAALAPLRNNMATRDPRIQSPLTSVSP
jgi:hypothetical protein